MRKPGRFAAMIALAVGFPVAITASFLLTLVLLRLERA